MNAPVDAIAPLAGRIESHADFEKRVGADFRVFKSKYRALTMDHLDDPGPEYDYLIDGWLSIGDKSVIGGPSQSGKSFFAIHAGMCISTGREFFGAKVKPGLVIYIAGEGARGVKKRLRAWRQQFGVTFTKDTPFVLIQSPVDLYKQEGGDTEPLLAEIEQIRKLFPEAPLRLIVIDTLATAAIGADENSSRDIGLVLANVTKLNSRTGAHVALVHHMNADGTKLRGSTAIYANIEQAIYVTRNEMTKVRTAKIGKHKDEEGGTSVQFELMSVEVGVDVNGKPITSCVCLPVGEKEAIRKSEDAKGRVLRDDEIIFMKALFQAERKHGRAVPDGLEGVGDRVRSVVPTKDVGAAYRSMSPPDEIPDGLTEDERDKAIKRRAEAEKKELQRLRKALMVRGVIGVGQIKDEWFVWWTGTALRAFPWTIPRDDAPELPPLPADFDLSSVEF